MFYFAEEFQLWGTLIGQLTSVYKHRTKRRWLSKVYFQRESAYFRKKNSEIEFQN